MYKTSLLSEYQYIAAQDTESIEHVSNSLLLPHPANDLGWNEFNGLGFDMNCVWVDSNVLYIISIKFYRNWLKFVRDNLI